MLRALHGVTGLLLIAALFTAYWTYDTYDGRFGGLPLPDVAAMEGIHGTFGLLTLVVFPAFLIYAVHHGQQRLIQVDAASARRQVHPRRGTRAWWYGLHRGLNTWSLVALTFALFSGKMMNETWLPRGELHHLWYSLHLISWLIMVLTMVFHIGINARLGGVAWMGSIWSWRLGPEDHPERWLADLRHGWAGLRQRLESGGLQARLITSPLVVLESSLVTSLLLAWLIPLWR